MFKLLSFLQVIKEGLTKLSCLLSFDIITLELWTQIAPHWLDTIVESYPRDQLAELSRYSRQCTASFLLPLNKYVQQP